MTDDERTFLANTARLRMQGETLMHACFNCKHALVTERPWCTQYEKGPPPKFDRCHHFKYGWSPWRAAHHQVDPN